MDVPLHLNDSAVNSTEPVYPAFTEMRRRAIEKDLTVGDLLKHVRKEHGECAAFNCYRLILHIQSRSGRNLWGAGILARGDAEEI
jgi:hypothetical protein